jgi:phage terminase large subunit
MEIPVSDIYFKNLDAKTRYIFNEGGTRSTKTYSINQVFYTKAVSSPVPIILSIVSETMPHLRKGAMRDFILFLKNNNLYNEKYHNKSENIFEFNKSIVEFFSVDSPGKVHGPERDFLFVNECQYIDYDTFFHLAQRTRKQVFADWNPTSEFWVYEQFINNPQYKDDLTLIHSTLYDNPFISEEIKKDILLRAERDPNYRKVYLEGKIGQLEGVIYPNWSYGDFDESLPSGYGLDFGYYPDPDAMIKVAIDHKRKRVYAKECFYQTNQLVEHLKINVGQHARQNDLIVADSASPRMIAELKRQYNIKGVIKTAGSVNEGIRILQDYEIVTDKESTNLVKELRNYIWSDKKAGIPIDAFNHLLDPLRYYALTQLSKSSGVQTWHT